MIMEDEVEIWKTYPEFAFIQGSNLGRVRTIDRYAKSKSSLRLVRGHVLPQQRDKHGYMAVNFSVNGKHVRRFVHRIVLGCFVNNPNNLPQVNHKDCNPTNNCISNLEWCDASYNNRYREKYGKSQGHSLRAFNLETQEELCFCSQKEASRLLEINRRSIQSVLKGELNQAGGYYFTEGKNEVTREKLCEIKANMLFLGGVIAINVEMQEPLYFKSQHETERQLGIYNQSINAVLKGRRKTAGNYWFVYADENAVEKTRMKFSDEIANRVAKLMEG